MAIEPTTTMSVLYERNKTKQKSPEDWKHLQQLVEGNPLLQGTIVIPQDEEHVFKVLDKIARALFPHCNFDSPQDFFTGLRVVVDQCVTDLPQNEKYWILSGKLLEVLLYRIKEDSAFVNNVDGMKRLMLEHGGLDDEGAGYLAKEFKKRQVKAKQDPSKKRDPTLTKGDYFLSYGNPELTQDYVLIIPQGCDKEFVIPRKDTFTDIMVSAVETFGLGILANPKITNAQKFLQEVLKCISTQPGKEFLLDFEKYISTQPRKDGPQPHPQEMLLNQGQGTLIKNKLSLSQKLAALLPAYAQQRINFQPQQQQNDVLHQHHAADAVVAHQQQHQAAGAVVVQQQQEPQVQPPVVKNYYLISGNGNAVFGGHNNQYESVTHGHSQRDNDSTNDRRRTAMINDYSDNENIVGTDLSQQMSMLSTTDNSTRNVVAPPQQSTATGTRFNAEPAVAHGGGNVGVDLVNENVSPNNVAALSNSTKKGSSVSGTASDRRVRLGAFFNNDMVVIASTYPTNAGRQGKVISYDNSYYGIELDDSGKVVIVRGRDNLTLKH